MKETMKWTVALLFAGAILVGCTGSKAGEGGEGGKVAESGKKIKVCLLPKTKSSPYFTSCADGAKQAADELGDVDLIYDGPTDDSVEKAAGMVEQWTLQKVDVIAVSPSDPDVLGSAMKKALKAGVKVITWDADAAKDTRSFLVNQATPKEIGYALVDAMAKDLGGDKATGEVAIITANSNAANQNQWIGFIKERLQKYPGLKFLTTKPAGEDQKLAFQITNDFMNAYPNLKGIFAISSTSFPAAAEAIKQAGKSGKILVTGLGTPDTMRAYVKDGTVKSVILWNTVDLGYLTIQVAHAVAKGELKPGATTFKAGRLGEMKVEGDNVLLGGILVFNKDNIDKYKF